jgi:hypothetical protein
MWDDGEVTPDGGNIVYVHICHMPTGGKFAGLLIRHEEEMFIDTVMNVGLPAPTAIIRRLLAKISNHFVGSLPDDCPAGFQTVIELSDFLGDVYEPQCATRLSAMIESSLLMFDRQVTDQQTADSDTTGSTTKENHHE